MARRRLLRSVGSARKESSEPGVLVKLNDNTVELMNLIRTMPIVSLSKHDLLRVFVYGVSAYGSIPSGPRYSRGVDLTTIQKFYKTERLIQQEKRDYARAYFNRYESDDGMDFEKYKPKDWMEVPIDALSRNWDSSANVRVNLLLQGAAGTV